MKNIKSSIAILLIISLQTYAAAKPWDKKYCASLKGVSQETVSNKQLIEMYNKIIKTCKNNKQKEFYTLFTDYQNSYFSSISSTKREEFYNDACKFFMHADHKLAGDVANGTHTIEDKKRTSSACGIQVSYWNIYTKEHEKVFRVKLAYQNDSLKINEH